MASVLNVKSIARISIKFLRVSVAVQFQIYYRVLALVSYNLYFVATSLDLSYFLILKFKEMPKDVVDFFFFFFFLGEMDTCHTIAITTKCLGI